MTSEIAVGVLAEGRDLLEQAGQPVGQADRRVGRGEEADERQAELGDGQEPTRVVEQAADPARRRGCPRR